MSETAHELVQRGAALLDEKLPGWADQIDLDTLRMSDGCRCVLGQIGCRELNRTAEEWEDIGLGTPFGMLCDAYRLMGRAAYYGFARSEVSYDELQDAWKGEIVARRTLDV